MKHTTYSPKDHAENPRNWPRLEAEGNRAADDNARLEAAQTALKAVCQDKGQSTVLAAAKAAGLAVPQGAEARRMSVADKAAAIEAIVAAVAEAC